MKSEVATRGDMSASTDGWMESSDVLSLFPTLVWKILLAAEVRQDIDTSVREVLELVRRGSTALEHGEAWQSERNLHELPGLAGLVACIDRASRSAMRSLRINYDAFEITGCWANISAPGASHGMHSHPNNFLSGVYYLQTRAGADTVNFHDPRSQSGIIRPPGDGIDTGKHRSGSRERERRYVAYLSILSATLRRTERERRTPDKRELQYYVFGFRGKSK